MSGTDLSRWVMLIKWVVSSEGQKRCLKESLRMGYRVVHGWLELECRVRLCWPDWAFVVPTQVLREGGRRGPWGWESPLGLYCSLYPCVFLFRKVLRSPLVLTTFLKGCDLFNYNFLNKVVNWTLLFLWLLWLTGYKHIKHCISRTFESISQDRCSLSKCSFQVHQVQLLQSSGVQLCFWLECKHFTNTICQTFILPHTLMAI